MKKINYILFLFLISIEVNSQALSNKMWDHRYGGSDNEYPTTLIPALDNGFLLCGYTTSTVSFDVTENSRGLEDYWIVKTDNTGNILWDKRFGGYSDDYINCGIALLDSGFIIAGNSKSGLSGDKSDGNRDTSNQTEDYWVIRIDKNGNKIWDKTFGGDKREILSQILLLTDGSYLLIGYSNSDNSGDKSQHGYGLYDYWIVKIDTNGNKIWDRTYGGIYSDVLNSACITSDHGFVLGGFSNSPANICKSQNSIGGDDYWIIKIDSNGTELWDKTIGGNNLDRLYSILVLPNDNLLLSGSSKSDIGFDKSVANHGNNNLEDFWIIKTNASGNKIWDNVFGGFGLESGINKVSLIYQGILISGVSDSDISGDKSEDNIYNTNQGWAIAIDTMGHRLWDKTINNPEYIFINYGIQNKDSCYTFLSFAYSDGGDVSQIRNSQKDFWIVKFCPSLSAIQDLQISDEDFSVHYSSKVLSININSRAHPTALIEVSDELGKIILSKKIILQNGENSITLNTENSLSGIYFIKLIDSNKILTRKIFIH